MPPELVMLGDQLEAAAARAIARRRSRRQQVLNAAASLVLAVPVAVALATSHFTTSTVPVTTATPTPRVSPATRPGAADGRSAPVATRDVLPRDLHRLRLSPQAELLLLPSSLRPALR